MREKKKRKKAKKKSKKKKTPRSTSPFAMLLRCLALLALVVACVHAQTAVNPTFDGCAGGPGAAAAGWDNNLGSVDANIYFGTVPGALGACLSDFVDDAGTTIIAASQTVNGFTVGADYDVSIDFACTLAGSVDCTFTISIDGNVSPFTASAPAAGDATIATFTTTFTAAAASIPIVITHTNPGTLAVPITIAIVDNVDIVLASVVGDPHFIGFAGQMFDYIGEPQTSFNLLSDFDVQLNAHLYLMKANHHTFISGPVMNEIALLCDGHTVYINAGGYEKPELGYVTVDGVRLSGDKKVSFGRLSVHYKPILSQSKDIGLGGSDYLVGSVKIVIEDVYSFHVVLVENGHNINKPEIWVTALPRRFLDFTAHILDQSRHPHGVFGQTAHPDKNVPLYKWRIEGEESDYVLSDGLFGTGFKYNKFVPTH